MKMYINAYIPYNHRIILYCDLSHENFIFLVENLHKLGYLTQATDSGEFSIYSKEENEQPNIHTMWADEETFQGVIKAAQTLSASNKGNYNR
jgi:hypothetical protein